MMRSAKLTNWSRARRILCVRLDAMGDVLMTAPALSALSASPAHPSITLLTSPAGAKAASLLRSVDNTIVWKAPWMKHRQGNDGLSVPDMIELLRNLSFDAAVIFTVYSQSPLPAAVLLQAAGIPLRAAYCRENPYGLLTEWIPETEPECTVRHEVARQAHLVSQMGFHRSDERISVDVPPWAMASVSDRLKNCGIEPFGKWLVAHAGAAAKSRIYPPERLALALRRLHSDAGYIPLITGDPADVAPVVAALDRGRVPVVPLADSLSLPELAALIQSAPLLISNNSGPAHLAAGVGCPVVVTYALTNPQHTPWQVPSRVLFRDVPCRYCYKSVCPLGTQACLRPIPSRRVAEAALELLGLTGGRERQWPALPALR